MKMSKQEFITLLSEVMVLETGDSSLGATLEEVGLDSVSRLSMIAFLESHFGATAIFEELNTVENVSTLLIELRSRGFVE